VVAESIARFGDATILHALQETFGYVDGAAVPLIAEALNLSRAEVHAGSTVTCPSRVVPCHATS
jgi:formate dehydrogenase subunit gamma